MIIKKSGKGYFQVPSFYLAKRKSKQTVSFLEITFQNNPLIAGGLKIILVYLAGFMKTVPSDSRSPHTLN